jgi:hypothetical protein
VIHNQTCITLLVRLQRENGKKNVCS